MANKQALPRGDANKFSQIVTCYERREYKRGHKLADEILKRHPTHGETQAMKGLLYNSQENKEEAYTLVKEGLKNNIRSHICWHVYGLIYRSDANYKEATKCYLNAMRINTSNTNIMKDLSLLQIQLRDHEGFLKTRKQLLDLKPNLKTNWLFLAVAAYFSGDYTLAFEIFEKMENAKLEESTSSTAAYEYGEIMLFKNRCLESNKDYSGALQHLKDNESKIVDKLSYHVKTAQLLCLLREYEEAKAKWLFLLKDQPENYRFHNGLQCSILQLAPEVCEQMFKLKKLELPSTTLSLSSQDKEMLLDVYRSEEVFRNIFAQTVKRKIMMTLLEGQALCDEIDSHMRKSLTKGLPALYHDVCSLMTMPSDGDGDSGTGSSRKQCKLPQDYHDNPIMVMVCTLVDGYIDNLKSNGTLGAPSGVKGADPGQGTNPGEIEPPTSLLWALYLRCHLYECCGDLEKALFCIDECISHTPTATDIILKKARILKKMGDVSIAATVADSSRALDLQDRYLNNKATKYAMRADLDGKAFALMEMFARYEGDPQSYLADMQCNWFELECGNMFSRMKKWGQSLKKYYSIRSHFSTYVEDMFDFHAFSIRKQSLRVYEDALEMQDAVLGHPFFQQATAGALTILLHLCDDPEDVEGLGHLPTKERKKEREKRKKQKAKEAKAEEERLAAALEEAQWLGNSKSAQASKDTDPYGDNYLTKNFLEEAYNWCLLLLKYLSRCTPQVLALCVDTFIRKSKAMLAMKCLQVGMSQYPNHPSLLPMFMKFAKRFHATTTKSTKPMSKHTVVKDLVRSEFQIASLLNSSTAEEYLNSLITAIDAPGSVPRGTTQLEYRYAVARSKLILNNYSKEAQLYVEEHVLPGSAPWAVLLNERGISVHVCERLCRDLLEVLKLPDLVETFKRVCKEKWPHLNMGTLSFEDGTEEGVESLSLEA